MDFKQILKKSDFEVVNLIPFVDYYQQEGFGITFSLARFFKE